MELSDVVFLITVFNSIIQIGALLYLVMGFKHRTVYKYMNIVLILALLYMSGLSVYSVISGVADDSILKMIGVTLGTFAIISAVVAEVND